MVAPRGWREPRDLSEASGITCPRVYVVIPVRNAAPTLKHCLQSVMAQPEVSQDRVLVVDNGSSDESAAIALALGVRTYTCSQKGPGPARNMALDAMHGESCNYVLFVDADVELPSAWVARALDCLESAGPRCAGVGGPGRSPGESLAEKALDASLWNWSFKGSGGTRVDSLATMDALFRYSAVRGMRFRTDLPTGEDPEYCFHLRDTGWLLLAFGDLAVVHRNPTTVRHVATKWYSYGVNYLTPYSLHPRRIGAQVVLRCLYVPVGLFGVGIVTKGRGLRRGLVAGVAVAGLPWVVLFGRTVSRSGRLGFTECRITFVQWVRFAAQLAGMWVGILEMRPFRARQRSKASSPRGNDKSSPVA